MAAYALLAPPGDLLAQAKAQRLTGTRIKLGLNAFSFNGPLRAGKMTLDDVIDFARRPASMDLIRPAITFPVTPRRRATPTSPRSRSALSSTG